MKREIYMVDGRKYESLAAALAAARKIFDETGFIVAVERK